jgi:hypothetical protein
VFWTAISARENGLRGCAFLASVISISFGGQFLPVGIMAGIEGARVRIDEESVESSMGTEPTASENLDTNKGFAGLPLAVAMLLTAGLVLLTCAFGTWTATSVWSFPRFLLAVLGLIYLPGRLLVQIARVRLTPLEHLTLALVLGMSVGSVLYWLAGFLGAPRLFLLWPGIATSVCVYRGRNAWKNWRGGRFAMDGSHVCLTAVILLAWGLLVVAPLYARNMALLPEGGLSMMSRENDVFLHLSLANELTHSIPPQIPFVAGKELSYHYGVDVLAAMFMTSARLNAFDLTVRFLPTFHLAVVILAVFIFSRAWLKSGYLAVTTTFLVMFGEDFSYLPGLLFGSKGCWSAQYFGVPTTFSLYYINPMLPALGLLFGGFFCLHRFFEENRGTWLLLTAFQFAILLEYKVFTALHVALALFLAAVVYAALFRDLRFVKVLIPTGLLLVPLLLMTMQSNQAGAAQGFIFCPGTLVVGMLPELHWSEYSWARQVIQLLTTGDMTLAGVAAYFLIAVPVFLFGSLGPRVLGLPLLAKTVAVPKAATPLRWFLGLFVVVGALLSLTFLVGRRDTSPAAQYNNAVWFFVQSKYVAWLFVGEVLVALGQQRSRAIQVGMAALVVALSVPSTIQFFHFLRSIELRVLEKNELAMLTFLNDHSAPGAVVVTRQQPTAPVAALTRCRTVLSDVFAASFVSAQELEKRSQDLHDFWAGWDRGELRTDLLVRYQVAYLVVGRQPGESETRPASAGSGFALELCFTNDRFWVYQARRSPRGT